MRAAVSTTAGAIGYLEIPSLDKTVKTIAYNGVEYTPENVYNGSYPLFTLGHMYTRGEPDRFSKDFLSLIISDDYQSKHLKRIGFLPVRKMDKR